MKILFTCGGTAGHVNPALAVAGRLKNLMPDCRFLFLGAEGKMEMDLVPREGYEIRPLKITNLSRERSLSGLVHNVRTVKNVFVSGREAKSIMREFKPDVVVGTGGYVCYPVLRAAKKLGIPTAVHDSNAVPGLTTKLLAGGVDAVMVGFEESRAYYPHPERVTVTGTPVRGAFAQYTQAAAKEQLGLPADQPLVVSVWGSLGAAHMNEIVCQMLPLMKGQRDFSLLHAAGSRYYAQVTGKLQEAGLDPAACGAQVREYIYDMPRVMAAADLILCRAGASTLSELCFMGKPAVIVPSPNVTNNHQEKNARVLERAGGARVLLEGEFDAEQLLALIRELLADKEQLRQMSEAMRALSVPDATDKICGILLDLTQKPDGSAAP